MKLVQLQECLGYSFSDQSTLEKALTHKSYGHEFLQDRPAAHRDNERLEFLGDAVLDVVISDVLLETYPESDEGHLTKMRAAVVNERTLAILSREIRLGDYIRLGKGESQTGGKDKASILSSTFEALIAAIYLDGGFEPVYEVVRNLFQPFFTREQEDFQYFDYKTRLQEVVQAKWKQVPSYHLTSASGPDHAKIFEIEVRMMGEVLAKASGSSKKTAEQSAAESALKAIQQEQISRSEEL